jgi:hypothetical protein
MAFSILGSVSSKTHCVLQTQQELNQLDRVGRCTDHYDISRWIDHCGLGYWDCFCWNCQYLGAITKQVAVGHSSPVLHMAC